MVRAGTIKLASGRDIRLVALKQSLTYESLIEGLPTVERNQINLAYLMQEQQDNPDPGAPYLVPPVETPIPPSGNRPYRFGTPASFPAVTCVGRFTSLFPARSQSADFSGLVVV